VSDRLRAIIGSFSTSRLSRAGTKNSRLNRGSQQKT
jgi:hypothetical protein